MGYKLKKVFDCQDMPPEVRRAFFDWAQSGDPVSNRCYVSFQGDISKEIDEPGLYNQDAIPIFHTIHKWLIANGAGLLDEVLIHHWW